MTEPTDGQGGRESGAPPGLPPGTSIEALADRVYRLMLDEIRLERARGAAERVTRR